MATPVPQTYTSAAGAVGAGTVAVAVPTGVAANDIVLVWIYLESTATITAPAGFTLKQTVTCTGGSLHTQNLFWKRATAGDTGTYTFTWSGTDWVQDMAARVSGCVTSGDPFGAPVNTATSNSGAPSTVTPAVATLTPTENDCLVIFSGTNWNGGSPTNTWTPPTGFTERIDNESITMATLAQTTATATGSVTATGTNSEAGRTGLVAYLKPVPAVLTAAVTGTTTASSTVTALRTGIAAVTGTATASSTVTALRTGIAAVTGTATASSSVVGVGTDPAVVSGSATASSAVTALRTDSGAVTGTATASAVVAATTGTPAFADVTGTVTVTSTVTASAVPPLEAAVTGEVTADAIVSAALVVPTLVDVEGVATATAEIRAVIGFYFRTPTFRQRPYTRHGLWARTYLDVGITVLKFGSSYRQYTDPDPTDISGSDVVYIGGHLYFIDPIEAQELTAAGYGSWISDDPGDPFPDVDYSQYGVGFYGTGPYGD